MNKERLLLDQGKWVLTRESGAFIVTSDEELLTVAENPYHYKERTFQRSFSEVCQDIKQSGGKIVGVSYDFSFGGKERKFYPSDPECIRAYKALYNVAREYGLLFTASIISPLDLGPAYVRKYNHIGYWYQYEEIECKKDGKFEVTLPLQKVWFHNKGPCHLTLDKVIGYRYREKAIDRDHFYVSPNTIQLIKEPIKWEVIPDSEVTYHSGYARAEVNVRGKVSRPKCDESLLIILVYKAEEIDYFSPQAQAFIYEVIDLYKDAGIRLSGFYSDEMHMQFDWDLAHHFGRGEIQIRYLTPNLNKIFASCYGEMFDDLAKYLVYFAHHSGNGSKDWPIEHVMGSDLNGIYRTWLLRHNYFTMLNEQLVDIYVKALKYAEKIFDTTQYTQAHATWQESPTCDQYAPDYTFGKIVPKDISRYDYGPEYVASSSIREALSGCYDYFKWGEFLTGEGNDFPEGGNLDRNYYAMAMSCSFANINKFPVTYCGSWGSPKEATNRFLNVASAYGVINSVDNLVRYVQDFQTRSSPVLMLYPLDLVYSNDRFGSWMVQYGYADYITEGMLLKHASITSNGNIKLYNKGYNTLVILFQPFIKQETLSFINEFVNRGGKLLWTSIPPRLFEPHASSCFCEWSKLFGLKEDLDSAEEIYAKDKKVEFVGYLSGIEPMSIPTRLFPDKVYRLTTETAEPAALLEGKPIGFMKNLGKGKLVYLGFRVRDNQSEGMFTLFKVLEKIGSYPQSSAELLSHHTPYFFAQFPNGTISVARHYYRLVEDWTGEFFRKEEKPREYPSTWISLRDKKIWNHIVSYEGDRVMSYKLNAKSNLISFAGYSTTGIKIDGIEYKLIDKPGDVLFARITEDRLFPDIAQCWVIYSSTSGPFTFLMPLESISRAVVLDKTQTYIAKDVTRKLSLNVEGLNISGNYRERFVYLS